MNTKLAVQNLMCRLMATAIFCGLTACALGSQVVHHAFSFDAAADSPGVEVLDYRYGDSKLPTASNPEHRRKGGMSLQATNIMGPMRRGNSLYVKWRIKSTGEVYDDTVDLSARLPLNIEDHRIYFVIQGPQLYVYLISPERRPPDMPRNGPSVYSYLKTTTIYPDQR